MTDHEDSKLGDEESKISALIFAGTGIPVPPTVIRNTLQTITTLVGALVALPVAKLNARTRRINDDADARSAVTKAYARAAVKQITKDSSLHERAELYHRAKILGEQANREAITFEAVEELKVNLPSHDAPTAIEQDWLNLFSRHAETKSSDEMRTYFGRVLAGEIRRPGTFSPTTIEVLARLTPDLASLFQKLCNISTTVWVLGAPLHVQGPMVLPLDYGDPGGNGLVPLGLSFDDLTALQEVGLIPPSLHVAAAFGPIVAVASELEVGGRRLAIHLERPPDEIATHQPQALSVMFSRAGCELRTIVSMTPPQEYLARIVAWCSARNIHLEDAST